ncbi:MAG: hypothetical protein M1823_003440 [Watsoniomyces obsoletus]|nr:MAG: hypothetical protein M1823_003440 [Watsoniomyces obsoletus]
MADTTSGVDPKPPAEDAPGQDSPSSISETPRSAPETSPSFENQQSQRVIPPIITFPEFLLRPSAPPQSKPFLRPRDVFDTVLLAGGLSATLYTIHRYVLSPMTESLTQARKSLAATALTNLSLLNTKLEASVSVIPDHQPSKLSIKDNHGDPLSGRDLLVNSETSSISDPTELFHVDVGTQTSTDLLLSAQQQSQQSSGKNGAEKDKEKDKDETVLNVQTGRLRDIQSELSDIVDSERGAVEVETALRSRMTVLTTYLETLSSSPSNNYLFKQSNEPYQRGYKFHGHGVVGAGVKEDIIDPLGASKKEIKEIKAALLNPKNFPPAASNPGAAGGGGSVSVSVSAGGGGGGSTAILPSDAVINFLEKATPQRLHEA